MFLVYLYILEYTCFGAWLARNNEPVPENLVWTQKQHEWTSNANNIHLYSWFIIVYLDIFPSQLVIIYALHGDKGKSPIPDQKRNASSGPLWCTNPCKGSMIKCIHWIDFLNHAIGAITMKMYTINTVQIWKIKRSCHYWMTLISARQPEYKKSDTRRK